MKPERPRARKRPTLEEGPLWETLSNGKTTIKVLRGFDKKAACPEYPQRRPEVVIVDLSAKDYATFKKSGVEFVNSFGIFSCPVTSAKAVGRVSRRTKLTVRLSVVHEPDCGYYYY